MTTKHDPYHLFASVNWCANNKLKILYLEKTKFYNAIDKDLKLIESKIEKIIKKKFDEHTDLALVIDLKIIKKKLHFTRKQFNNINKIIKDTWTKIYGVTAILSYEIESDEERLSNIIYDIDFGNSFFHFNNEIHFIQQNMKNTINYLSRFGCVIISIEGLDTEVVGDTHHPWYKLLSQGR